MFVAVVAGAAACSPSQEDAFRNGRGLQPCFQSLNFCNGRIAQCRLDDQSYAEHRFPGSFSFITEAVEGQDIEILMFYAAQRDPGISTRILWREPGCSDLQTYDSEGRDVFAEAGDDAIFSQSQEAIRDGEHLIEIFSDSQADVLISVNVTGLP